MRVPAIPDSGALQSIDNHRGQGISYSGSHANRYWECLRHVRYQWEWRCCPLRIQGPARYSGFQCSQGNTCRGVVLPCRKGAWNTWEHISERDRSRRRTNASYSTQKPNVCREDHERLPYGLPNDFPACSGPIHWQETQVSLLYQDRDSEPHVSSYLYSHGLRVRNALTQCLAYFFASDLNHQHIYLDTEVEIP